MKKYFLFIFSIPFLIQCDGEVESDLANDLSKQLQPKTQPFLIDQSKDTLITCDKGTLVHFSANSFVLENGEAPEGIIEIDIQEYYSTKDLISRDLVTMSDTSLLVSGGMIDVTAWAGSDKCYLKSDHPFTIFFPKEEGANTNMQLFYSEETEAVNWKLNPEKVFDAEAGGIVPYDSDALLECGLNWERYWGHSYKGMADSVILPDLSAFYAYRSENFVFSSEMKKYFCENPDEYLTIAVDFDENAKILSAEVYSDSTRFDRYVITFFDTLSQSFDSNGAFTQCSIFFSMSSTSEPSSDDFVYSFNEKYSEFRDEAMDKVDDAELNYYVMNSISFGLINCDYFLMDEGEKIDFVVKSKLKAETKVYLLFEEEKSMMLEKEYTAEGFVFRNIPKGKKVKVIAINYAESQPRMAVEYITADAKGTILSDFKTFTIQELDEELENL